jgi:hypothetical protein
MAGMRPDQQPGWRPPPRPPYPRPPRVWVRDQLNAGFDREARKLRWARRHWLLLVSIPLAFFLCLGGSIFAVFVLADKLPAIATDRSNLAAMSFFDLVQHKQLTDAYAELCRPAKDTFTQQMFNGYVEGQKPLATFKIDTRYTKGPGMPPSIAASYSDWAVWDVRLTFTDDSDEIRQVPVVQEVDGVYRVCGHPY